jgi:hypothetical protein
MTATTVSNRTWRAGLTLGGGAVATIAFVLWRLLETWHLGAAAHSVTLLGLRVSYPAANVGAIVVLLLAAGGLIVLALAGGALARELAAGRRLRRLLADRVCDVLPGGEQVLAEPKPWAFCTGLVHPRVYVTSGAVDALDADALAVVLAHERHHARRYDPLRLATARVLARALFFVPGLDGVLRRAGLLSELGADESAVACDPVAGRPALARAILGFGGGVEPERVDRLLGLPVDGVGFPLLLSLVALAAVALFAAVALLAGRVASGSATLALPVLSRQPCVLVLAGVPALAGLVALAWARGASETRQ